MEHASAPIREPIARCTPAGLIGLATIATAWPAAGYGALVIWAAGDFASTGTLWIFGWPFLAILLAATTLHLLAVGGGTRWGVPPVVPDINAFDAVLADAHRPPTRDPATLRLALRSAVRFPVWNEIVGLVLASFVTVLCAGMEGVATGSASPNVRVILRGGLYATALYGAASMALGELLTRPACRALRRMAAAAGLDPYDGFVLGRRWRIAALVVPTVVALLVAVEIGRSAQNNTVAYTTLIMLAACVTVALSWLQYENSRSAVRELRDACRDLAAGHEGGLVTGSIEPDLIAMAQEFTATARRVGADRRDSGERYRAVFEEALDGIITMDHEGRIREFNPAAERIFGYRRADVLGARLVDAIIPPALRAAHTAGVAHHLATNESHIIGQRIELPAMRADGSEFPAEVAITRIRSDGPPMFTAHLRDIADRKQAEAALTASTREAEEQAAIAAALLAVGETINAHLHHPDMLDHVSRCTVDALGCDGSSIFVRDRERDAFALRANSGGRPEVVAELRHVDFAPEGFPLLRELKAGQLLEVADLEQSPLTRSLAFRISSLLAAPISRGDRVVGMIVATYRERTGPFTAKQRRLALGIAHATAIALENARLIADLQTANRLKTEFVSTMSHELRTPLNVILGFCEMARDPAVDPAERDICHQRIALAGRTLLEMVESTLAIGKLEAGREEVRLEEVDLTVLWERLGQEYARLPRERPVAVEWMPSDPHVAVLADPHKLAIVIRNLIGNALKFTDRGRVRAEAVLEGDFVAVRVSDTGIGIAPADQQAIFEMFRQADGSDSRRHEGSGLGLYIVHRFVEQLGGTVELESTPGQGSVFTVRVPRVARPAAASAQRR